LEQLMRFTLHQECYLPDPLVLSMLLQLCSGIIAMQWYIPNGGMVHNDAYFRNILVDAVPPSTVFAYHFPNNRVFYCKTYGWLLKFGDFGWTSLLNWDAERHEMGLATKRIRNNSYINWEHILAYKNIDSIRRDLLAILINWLAYTVYQPRGGLSPRMSVYLQDFADELFRLGCVQKEVFAVGMHKRRWMRSCKTPSVMDFVKFVESKFEPTTLLRYNIDEPDQMVRNPEVTSNSWPDFVSILGSQLTQRLMLFLGISPTTPDNNLRCGQVSASSSQISHSHSNETSNNTFARLTKATKRFQKKFRDYKVAALPAAPKSYEVHHYYPTDNSERTKGFQAKFQQQIEREEQEMQAIEATLATAVPMPTPIGANELSKPFLR